eukprot:12416534-Karenia_brevis.AAC.1
MVAGIGESTSPSIPPPPTATAQQRASRPRRRGGLLLSPRDSITGPQGLMSLRDMLLTAGFQVEPQHVEG